MRDTSSKITNIQKIVEEGQKLNSDELSVMRELIQQMCNELDSIYHKSCTSVKFYNVITISWFSINNLNGKCLLYCSMYEVFNDIYSSVLPH